MKGLTDWLPKWGVIKKEKEVERTDCSAYFSLPHCPKKNNST